MKERAYPTAASLLLSEDCNLACKYCFEIQTRNQKKKNMSKEVATKAIDMLFENAILGRDNEAENKAVSITLFGGEPHLNPDALEAILEYGLLISDNTGIEFDVLTITNGTILTDRIFNIYKKFIDKGHNGNFAIQISVDGTKEYNDINRVTRSGKGSFDLIEKNRTFIYIEQRF